MFRYTLLFGATAVAMAVSLGAQAAGMSEKDMAEREIVIDAGDLYRVPASSVSHGFSSLMDRTVYGNAGGRVGEVEDFVISSDGNVYAVIDTSDGPIEEIADLADDEIVIVPIQELRFTTMSNGRPQQSMNE